MTNPLAQDLGGVVRLLEKATPGPWTVGRFGSVHRPKVEGSESSVGSAIVVGGSKSSMYDGYQENCEAIAACVNFLRAHSAEIAGALRDADGWQPIESAPRDGTYILVCNSHGSWIAKWKPVFQSGFRPSNPWASMMLNHDHIERPGRFDHPTHWRPLPAPPTQDSAMQQGGGGGEAAA